MNHDFWCFDKLPAAANADVTQTDAALIYFNLNAIEAMLSIFNKNLMFL